MIVSCHHALGGNSAAHALDGNSAAFDMMIATITPKMPKADPKISIIRIFTKSVAS